MDTVDDEDKATAMRQLHRLAKRQADVERELRGAIKLAAYTGASLREIAEATGMSHMTVKRLLERDRAAPA